MRVLIAVHGFPPTHIAGAERAAERIVNWLVAHHHDVAIFTIESTDDPNFRVETKIENGAKVHRVFCEVRQRGKNDFANSYNYRPIGDALRAILSEQHFDLVHMISGYLLGGQVIHIAHEFGVPVALTLTEFWFMCARLNLLHPNGELCTGPESDAKCARCLMEEQRRYRLPAQYAPTLTSIFWSTAGKLPMLRHQADAIAQRRILLNTALNDADLVISPSQFLISKFAEFGFNTSRFVHIRHGLMSPPRPKQTSAESIARALIIGYAGQLQPHKGIDLVVNAVKQLIDTGHNLRLEIWGPENQAPQYTADLKKSTEAYPQIHWNGRYAGSQVWDILNSFDVIVVPSRWYENSPTVILEAFSLGLPVVTTNLGGMAELVQHEKNGLVFELNDMNDLRCQLERLLSDPELLPRLKSGIPRVSTADEEVEQIFAHYEMLVSRS